MLVSYHIFVSHYSISDLTVVIFPKIRDTTEQGVFMGQKDLSEKILVAYDDVFADIQKSNMWKRYYSCFL